MINVMQAFSLNKELKQEGEVGIEVEAEGENLPTSRVKGWNCTEDNSLRGEAREYVLQKAAKRAEVPALLRTLEAAYEREGTILSNSFRTSVHVHINVQDMPILKWYNFITIYTVLEDILVEFCGQTRAGNLFCLRTKDAEYVLDALRLSALKRAWGPLHDDHLRYAGLNVKASATYGSLEFRTMRGTGDFDLIQTWVNILLALKDSCDMYGNPKEIVEDMSVQGPDGFFNKILGKYPFLYNRMRHAESILEGARRIQDLAYCVNWPVWEKGFSKNIFNPAGGAVANEFVVDIEGHNMVDGFHPAVAPNQPPRRVRLPPQPAPRAVRPQGDVNPMPVLQDNVWDAAGFAQQAHNAAQMIWEDVQANEENQRRNLQVQIDAIRARVEARQRAVQGEGLDDE